MLERIAQVALDRIWRATFVKRMGIELKRTLHKALLYLDLAQ